MKTLIALFRGINVGGHNKLPMQDLRDIFRSLGCTNVRTYIQSGNAVFDTACDSGDLAPRLVNAIDAAFGFAPGVLLLDQADFRTIAAANPYTAAEVQPASLHVLFLAQPPLAGVEDALAALQSSTESFTLTERALYLHAPDGIGRSKLAARAENTLGVEATGRNWRTVSKIIALADAIGR